DELARLREVGRFPLAVEAGVDRVRAVRTVSRHYRGHDLAGRLRDSVAAVEVCHLSPVDGEVHGPANAEVVEGRSARVQEDERGRALRDQVNAAWVACGELFYAIGRDAVQEE